MHWLTKTMLRGGEITQGWESYVPALSKFVCDAQTRHATILLCARVRARACPSAMRRALCGRVSAGRRSGGWADVGEVG